MKTRASKVIATICVVVLALVCIGGTKIVNLPRTRSVPTNSVFPVSIQNASGSGRTTYHVWENDLATNILFGSYFSSFNGWLWLTNGRVVIITNGITGQYLTYADGVPQWTTVVPGGGGEVTTAQLLIVSNITITASNKFETETANLEGATNGLTTRASNLEGATNGLNSGVNGIISRAITNTHTVPVTLNTNLDVLGRTTNHNNLTVHGGNIRLFATNGTTPSVTLQDYGTAFPQIVQQNAGGTEASPAALTSGDVVGQYGISGFGDSIHKTAFSIRPSAIGTFTDSAAPTLVRFGVGDAAGTSLGRAAAFWSAYNFSNDVNVVNLSNVFTVGTHTNLGDVGFAGALLVNGLSTLNGLLVQGALNAQGSGNSMADLTVTGTITANTNANILGTNRARWLRLDGGQTASRALVLDANTNVTAASGTPDGTKFLRDDNTYAVPPTGGTIAWRTNNTAAGSQNTANLTNNTDLLWVVTEQGAGSRVDIEGLLQNDAVEFDELQNISAGAFILRRTGSGTGNPEEGQADNTSIEVTSSAVVRRAALTGDVTASAGSATTTIAANAVTDAKFRQSGALSVPGRAANSAGNIADISATVNGQILQRTNNTLVWGKVPVTNDYIANADFLSAAGGSVVQFHDNTGIITNKPITLTDSDSVTGVLPLANSTTNFNVLDSGAIQAGVSIITNWQRLIGYSHFLRTTNLWADGGAGSLYSNTLFGISGGVSNLLWTNIQDGQDVVSWLFVSNGVSVGFPQFVAADFPDGAVVTPNTNCWTKIIVSRRHTTTNIQVFTALYTLEDGFNIVSSTNHASRTITKSVQYAPNFTNANLVGTTQADIITNAASLHFRVETRLIPTNNSLSNIVVNFAQTNVVELWATNNLTFTNWAGLAAGVESRKTVLIRPQLITRGVNWGQGIGYTVRVLTNANSPLWTTLTNDKTYAASFVAIGTNIFPTLTLWE